MKEIDEISDKLKMYTSGLDGYDLNLDQLQELEDRLIKVYIEIKSWPEKKYLKFRPQIRRKKRGEWYRNAYKNITEKWPSDEIKLVGSNRRPIGFVSIIKSNDIQYIRRISDIGRIKIIKVEGLRRKKQKRPKVKKYFAVKAGFVEQIEGMTKGLQRCEERIVLVKAYDFKDAERIAIKEFKEYEQTYLTDNGFTMVRWKFEEVINIYDVLEEEIDPKGTEVYSEFKYRRMKPEYQWHPEYADD